MHKKQLIGLVLIMLMVATSRMHAQKGDIENLFRTLEEKKDTIPISGALDEAEPVLERLARASDETAAADLPLILHETGNPRISIRRVATTALYVIATRPNGQKLLSTETATFAMLLTDPDIPIRRMSILAVATLRPDANSPLLPTLETYLIREDAVSTIGPAAATVLMEAAPNNADSTNAVVQYMRRKDQTSASRDVLLDAITHVAKSHNQEIAKEVAGYADDPNEQTSIHAIITLQAMGKSAILDNQQFLSRIAADTSRAPSVRTAATKALSVVP